MKPLLLFFFSIFTVAAFAQTENISSHYGYPPENAQFKPVVLEGGQCISEETRQEVRLAIAANKAKILQKNPNAFQRRGGHPLFVLPIRAKAGFNDYGYYTLHNQVDHNLTPNNNLEDYNCGGRTYDWGNGNHGGTDYILWPYPWTRMAQEVMEIVAAADGTIIDKRDGNFDLNCVNNGNPNWNGIIVEHADGSQAWYWHFKDGAITDKEIGDTVEAGEYLGAAGSSGSSDWPHLHFEVFDANDDRIDPYMGPCNDMNPDSWWESQPDYFVPTINRLSTHYSFDFYENCPNEEITYGEVNFEPGEQMVFRAFYRDIQDGAETDFTIYDPNGDVFVAFTWTADQGGVDYATSWAHFGYIIDGTWPDGVYTLEAVFGGNTYETIFGVNTNLGVEDLAVNEVSFYPNPVASELIISSKKEMENIAVYDLLGRMVSQYSGNGLQTKIDMSRFSQGLYLVNVTAEGKTSTFKILKK